MDEALAGEESTFCTRSTDASAPSKYRTRSPLPGNAAVVDVVCLLAAPRDLLFADAGNGWPHSALRYHWVRFFQTCDQSEESDLL